MSKKHRNPDETWLNPHMLEWAREWRGFSLEEVAEKFKKTPDQIRAWELSESAPTPTVIQARKLAALYHRSFSEFFLPSPPAIAEPKSLPDFRLHKDILDASHERESKQHQQWAEAQRESALDLFQELGETPPEIDEELFTNVKSDTEKAAEIARTGIAFNKDDQFGLRKDQAHTLPKILRSKLETVGILTLRHSQIKYFGIRGMCIAEFPLPTIVIGNEATTAQAFTIAHEFAHILLKSSGVSGPRSKDYEHVPEERWCDRFAAAFLMPQTLIEQVMGTRPSQPVQQISDDDLDEKASQFRVSTHAMLIRLVHLGYVAATYYWDVKKPFFDEQERDARTFGRSKYYGTRYRSQLGDLYTGLVMEAWSLGRITNHHAAQYMGIKNLKHLNDIRHEYHAE